MTLSNYFKKKEGFDRLFLLLKEKYLKTGAFKGRVTLNNLTSKEAKEISEFFRKICYEGDSITIGYKDIERILKGTTFENFSWEELLQDYFNTILVDKKTINEKEKAQEKENYKSLMAILDDEETTFFETILSNKALYTLIHQKYRKEPNLFQQEMYYFLHFTIHIYEFSPISLVMLSSKTGNPHFLDHGSKNQKLFLKLLSYKYNLKEPTSLEEKISFLRNFSIDVDQVSNDTLTYGLISDVSYINSFYDAKQILKLTLSNLTDVKKLDTKCKVVFVFENPAMMEYLKEIDIPIVITSGMPNYCLYLILELLSESENKIYYNGDFDPEGLIIASKLKQRFPNLSFLGYEEKYYKETMSNKVLNESRLTKLNKVNNQELEKIKRCLMEEKKCAYQEKNIHNIKKEIQLVLENKYNSN